MSSSESISMYIELSRQLTERLGSADFAQLLLDVSNKAGIHLSICKDYVESRVSTGTSSEHLSWSDEEISHRQEAHSLMHMLESATHNDPVARKIVLRGLRYTVKRLSQ